MTQAGTLLDAGTDGRDDRDEYEKGGRRWEAWEASLLLGATLDGVEPAEIARVLRRSESAIGRELGRLLNGEVTGLPTDSHIRTLLPKVRERLEAQGRWSPPRQLPPGSIAAVEQYGHMVSEMRGNRAVLDRVERMQIFMLAVQIFMLAADVIWGVVTVAEIALFCGVEISTRVDAVARQIRTHRAGQELPAGPAEAAATSPDCPEQTTTAGDEPPLVQTGPGGDFRQPWPPETTPV